MVADDTFNVFRENISVGRTNAIIDAVLEGEGGGEGRCQMERIALKKSDGHKNGFGAKDG